MIENFSVWDFSLKDEDMQKISKLDTNKGYLAWYFGN